MKKSNSIFNKLLLLPKWKMFLIVGVVFLAVISFPWLIQKNRLASHHQKMVADATYKANLALELSLLTTKIEEHNENCIQKYPLSLHVIEQIIALSCQLKPYTYWNEEACSEELLSPERGQLLQTLINTKIDTTSLMAIYAEADFSYAILKKAYFSHLDFFKGVDLNHASLQAADLMNANLQRVNFSHSNLKNADLINTNLQAANLTNANLQKADLGLSKLQKANLTNANLQAADLHNTNLQAANLTNANLQGVDLGIAKLEKANLREANLQGADLFETQLQEANLRNANLQGTELTNVNLQGANLINVHLQGSDLYNVNLQEAKVNSRTWFTDLQHSIKPPFRPIIGVKDLMEKYKVDSSKVYRDEFQQEYYKIIET